MNINLNGDPSGKGDTVARLERAAKTSTTKEVGWPLFPEAITPDTPASILTEISKSPRLVKFKEELIRGAQARQALLILEQHKINQAENHLASLVPPSQRPKSWRKLASISQKVWSQKMKEDGPDCWDQPDYIPKFLRDNPACRIKHPK
jgi:hypothetical protein